jgi:hypothetical protein
MHDDAPEAATERLRLAFELFAVGEAMMREQLRREHPTADEAEIEARLTAWLRARPGDAEGRPGTWPRQRR